MDGAAPDLAAAFVNGWYHSLMIAAH